MARRRKRGSFLDSKEVFISVLAVLSLVAVFCFVVTRPEFMGELLGDNDKIPSASEGEARVYFIDVGQGDCQLIVGGNGETMLIDAGESEYGDTVTDFIRRLGIERLDYVVGTHPHSDHIGGLRQVISSGIEIGCVITPQIHEEYAPTTRTYERFLTAIEESGVTLRASKNESFSFGGGTVEIIQPEYYGDNYNNYSCCVIYEFGSVRFLFTGDLEKDMERQLVNRDLDLSADVLKVAHHGSATSSCYDFLDSVMPKYCVIGCGDSGYNHPNPDVVTRLKEYTSEIYRTDNNGTVTFTCDGSELSVVCER